MITTMLTSNWIEINANALINNICAYKKIINHQTLSLVIKGNAYGHGMVIIAKIADPLPEVNYFCVFKLSEAITLRNVGIKKPLLILGEIDTDPTLLCDNTISYLIGDLPTLQKLSAIAQQQNTIFSIHLKIDTGLSRFGFNSASLTHILPNILTLPNLSIEGIASHLAESESPNSALTKHQLSTFNTIVEQHKTLLPQLRYIHIANSAASSLYQLPYTNFFRIGLGIYGYWASPSIKEHTEKMHPTILLQPILSWYAKIIHINHVPAGRSVGYKQTFITSRNTTIGVLPIGYSDGYLPELSNIGVVKINDVYAPIIGRIAMNTILIDITDVPNASIGSIATIIGDDPYTNLQALANHTPLKNPRYISTKLATETPRIIINDITSNKIKPTSTTSTTESLLS